MLIHAATVRFDDTPVVLPPLSEDRKAYWRNCWERIGNPVLNLDHEHYVVGRETDNGRWLGVIR
jgi:hypothetical protein